PASARRADARRKTLMERRSGPGREGAQAVNRISLRAAVTGERRDAGAPARLPSARKAERCAQVTAGSAAACRSILILSIGTSLTWDDPRTRDGWPSIRVVVPPLPGCPRPSDGERRRPARA